MILLVFDHKANTINWTRIITKYIINDHLNTLQPRHLQEYEGQIVRTLDALDILNSWDKQGRYVFTKSDLAKLINEPTNLLNKTLERLTDQHVLIRVARGVYVFRYSAHVGAYTIEEIAQVLRRSEYNYVSLESALSEWGTISQVPIDRITVMTTGRKGEFRTPFGVIEFTHTENSPEYILANTIRRDPHPLPIASEQLALKNQLRVGRNIDLIEEAQWANQ